MTFKEIYDILKANYILNAAEIQLNACSEDEDDRLDVDFIYYNSKSNAVVIVGQCRPKLTSDDEIIYISEYVKQIILNTYVDSRLQERLGIRRCNYADGSYYEEHFSVSLRNKITAYISVNLMSNYKTVIEDLIECNNIRIINIENSIQSMAERKKKIQSSGYKSITTTIGPDGKPLIIYDTFKVNDRLLSVDEQITYIDMALPGHAKQIDSIKAENAILAEELSKIQEVTE